MLNNFFQNIKRAFMMIGFIVLLMALLIVADRSGVVQQISNVTQSSVSPLEPGPYVALISGHAGYDSGATCEDADGTVTLREADVVAKIAELTAGELRADGYSVNVLKEYDPRIDNLDADVLVSLHADSCLPSSGYKAASYTKSRTPITDERLLECINVFYTKETGLVTDPNTITTDMTEYHAFRKIGSNTPATIIELGYLGGDSELLTETPEIAALGVRNSIRCFLEGPDSLD